jgi:hypothetical protein
MYKRLSNADQNAANFFKVQDTESGCCGAAQTACKYRVVVATASAAFTALTFKDRNGDDKTVTFASASGVANIKAAIEATIEAEGYEDGYNDFENRYTPAVKVFTESTDTIIEVTGECQLVSITNGSGAQAFTSYCTQFTRATFYLAWAGNASAVPFVYNGTSNNITQPFANTATQVDTAITALVPALASVGASVVSVVKNATTSKFEITIIADSSATMSLEGTAFARTAIGDVDFK